MDAEGPDWVCGWDEIELLFQQSNRICRSSRAGTPGVREVDRSWCPTIDAYYANPPSILCSSWGSSTPVKLVLPTSSNTHCRRPATSGARISPGDCHHNALSNRATVHIHKRRVLDLHRDLYVRTARHWHFRAGTSAIAADTYEDHILVLLYCYGNRESYSAHRFRDMQVIMYTNRHVRIMCILTIVALIGCIFATPLRMFRAPTNLANPANQIDSERAQRLLVSQFAAKRFRVCRSTSASLRYRTHAVSPNAILHGANQHGSCDYSISCDGNVFVVQPIGLAPSTSSLMAMGWWQRASPFSDDRIARLQQYPMSAIRLSLKKSNISGEACDEWTIREVDTERWMTVWSIGDDVLKTELPIIVSRSKDGELLAEYIAIVTFGNGTERRDP